MPDKDNNFGGSLVLDFRKLWRHAQPKNSAISTVLVLEYSFIVTFLSSSRDKFTLL